MPLDKTTPNYVYKPNVFPTLLRRVNIPLGIVNKNILNFSRGTLPSDGAL
jgi:hypothetical protein